MMNKQNTINYGIDLGTTNSLIAKFNEGNVEILRNPVSWKETLASVVAFRNNRIIIGEKAREYLEKDPQNVIGSFKRKMGTTETYHIPSINQNVTPIELSAYILKELKLFDSSPDNLESIVITIPAAFDTVQSNATKEAGLLAGFKQVELLQEPIAASLAYANKQSDFELNNGYWLVYDLGGGTFDVALVKIENEEMRIIDHEGDNFLGGNDFDSLIVEKLIIPYLKYAHNYEKDAEKEFKSASGKYNTDWYILQKIAEEAKIELSRNNTTEIEIPVRKPDQSITTDFLEIRQTKFNELINNYIDETIKMVQTILDRNNMKSDEIQFILMVGGSTYIPYIRTQLTEILKIPVNTDIDPTTAVAVGAAYFAATKRKMIVTDSVTNQKFDIQVSMAYEKASKDTVVYFAAKIEGTYHDLFYKIIRTDGGYDSGLKSVESKISEDLPLVENMYNTFLIRFYDKHNNEVKTNTTEIGIAQGKYSIVGQPLPEDICLELDNPETKETHLYILFNKNSILPIHRTETRLVGKTIRKGSNDEFIINVLEGSSESVPVANKTIGFMAINGDEIKRDLIKGADVDLIFEISESRDLRITAYIPMLDQEFTQIFAPSKRHLPVSKLVQESEDVLKEIEIQITKNSGIENYETADLLKNLKSELAKIIIQAKEMSQDDITDKRYQLEDKKRKICEVFYKTQQSSKLKLLIQEYFDEKIYCKFTVEKNGNEIQKQNYQNIVKLEGEVINSENPVRIKDLKKRLLELRAEILWQNNEYMMTLFEWIKSRKGEFKNQEQGKKLLEDGEKSIKEQNYRLLRQINYSLLELLPQQTQNEIQNRTTGLI